MDSRVKRLRLWGAACAAVMILWGCSLIGGQADRAGNGIGENTEEDWAREAGGGQRKDNPDEVRVRNGGEDEPGEYDWHGSSKESGESVWKESTGEPRKSVRNKNGGESKEYGLDGADGGPEWNTEERSGQPAHYGIEAIQGREGGNMAGEALRMIQRRNRALRQNRIYQILENDIPLPSHYDARKDGRTAPVQDQRELGTCWAFSSLLALENALLPEEAWDFSEDHMSHNPNFILGQENGGEYTMSMAYLLAWQGPVREEQDPYGDGISPEGLMPVKHVQEIRILPEGNLEEIKRTILACGGVQSSLYTTIQNGKGQSEYYNPAASAYCYPKKTTPNHDVVIVGWDDDFPKEAFGGKAEGNGAFLCENSWGTEFGDNGFFYVSYYDGNLGQTNIAYTAVEEPDNYDGIYQSDLCGWVGQIGYGEDTAWAANVYTAEREEQVTAVGFYATGPNTAYQVYVLQDVPQKAVSALRNKGKPLAEGKLKHAGYYTVSLEEMVHVKPGERFAVMICLTTPGTIHPIAIEYDAEDNKSRIDLEDGEGYISYEGKYWASAEENQSCNICLKAYTAIR